jgi:hypothetical protein
VLRQLDATVPSAEGKCPTCGQSLRGWGRFCSQCGADLSGVAPGEGGASSDRLLEAVRQSAGSTYEVLGQMDRSEGGGVVYFARERDSGKIVALRLQKEAPAADGRERYNLGRTMVLNQVVGSLLGPEPQAPVIEARPTAAPERPAPAPASARPAPTRTRLNSWVLVAAVVALLVGAAAWMAKGRGTAAVPAALIDTTAATKADSGQIQVGGSLPPNTVITVNGDTISGTTLRQPAGTHRLRASAPGYGAAEQEVVLQAGQTIVWTPAMMRSGSPKPVRPVRPPVATAPSPPPKPAVKPAARPAASPPPDTVAGLAIHQAPAPPQAGASDTAPSGPLATGGATCASLFAALEWSRALVACEREAAGGQTAAQRTLATMYERGLATEANPATAVQWYAKAADAGDRLAQYRLGVLIRDGKGVKKNEKTALKWFQRSAEQGEAAAQQAVGRAFDEGEGVKRSRTTAATWYQKAAEQGNAAAQFRLGEFAEKGEGGIAKSSAEALKWYKLAAAQGHPEAREKVAKLTRD